MNMRAADIHILLAHRWRDVLIQSGVAERHLSKKHGPCPICGGRDRFRFDNKLKRGNWICTHCGSGDGFELIMRLRGVGFAEARREILREANIIAPHRPMAFVDKPRPDEVTVEVSAKPTVRALRVRNGTCEIQRCTPVVQYLESRKLWPLTPGHGLRAHPSFRYWNAESGRFVGSYSSLIADVRDIRGELVTVSVTCIENGKKLSTFPPRKMLSGTTGRIGCAVRIWPAAGEMLGIAEGIETAIAAEKLFRVPTWAALSASLLAKFEPPAHVKHLMIFADHDAAGLTAATKLRDRLRGRLSVAIRAPLRDGEDWADVHARVGDSIVTDVFEMLEAQTL